MKKTLTVKEFVYEIFLRLTSKTCPHGYEDKFIESMQNILPDLKKDQHGNYYYQVGESKTIFTSHIDTVSKDYVGVQHVIENNIIKTDGQSTLGADDKAGMTIMLWMIRNNVPGLYYFFVGEEVGCIGSGLVAKYGNIKGKYDRIISFDRKGTDSVITHQSSIRSCSDKFANDLCRELSKSGLKYRIDDTGVYTDSAEFIDLIPECTNISVGYYSEHTFRESQDIEHLTLLSEACVKVNWESLSTNRNPGVTEYKKYNNYGWKSYSDYDSSYGRGNRKRKRNRSKNYRKYSLNYSDDWYEDNHSFGSLNQKNDSKVYFSNGDDLLDITIDMDLKVNKYDWLVDKFSKEELTIDELEFVKENYLDMNSDYDKFFYRYLTESTS